MPVTSIPGFSEPFSSISHLLSAGVGVVSSFYLIPKGRGSIGRQLGLILYSGCMVFLFAMSGTYHLLERGTSVKYFFRILDYVAIYTMIAGTFTPIHLILFRGIHRWLIVIIAWILAIAGLTITSLFFDSIPEWVFLAFYLGLGWLGVLSFRVIYRTHRTFAAYIAAGGLAYTAGALLDFLKWPVLIPGILGPHEIFHICVIAGALFHWLLIYRIADYRPISKTA